MGVYIEAIIKHELTVEQIVDCQVYYPKSPYDEFKGGWNWNYPSTDSTFIRWLWSLSIDEYLKQPNFAALAAFISKDSFIISFNNEDIVSFSGLKDILFENNISARTEFQTMADNIYNLINGKEMLYVSDTLVDFYYAEKYISDIDSFDNFKAYLKQLIMPNLHRGNKIHHRQFTKREGTSNNQRVPGLRGKSHLNRYWLSGR